MTFRDEDDMTVEIRVPALGESVTEATIGQWFKKPGEAVAADEPVVELETDKVTIEVPAPASGVLESVTAETGSVVEVGALLGTIAEGATAEAPEEKEEASQEEEKRDAPPPSTSAPQAATGDGETEVSPPPALSPAVRRLVAEKNVDITRVRGTGKGGRILKEDVLRHLAETARPEPQPSQAVSARAPVPPEDAAREERVKMSRLRITIARRLKEAQNTAAMLTTFNEVDMTEVMALRNAYKELFQKKHGVKLGFMSFFVRAVTSALKEIPAINAEIDGDEIVYKNYYHIGVAVGTEKGLVVPVVREADTLSLAEIEKAIADFAGRARAGRLKIEEMQGGTFTITNGGVYGSLMSTPILNMPQSGILGMHKIQQRPMVMPDGSIQARPMMYLALTYDHRIVDGKEAVTFLVRVKEFLEDPKRLILDL